MTRWLSLVALLIAAPLGAQTAWISGTVSDAETGAPLAGALVFLDGTAAVDTADAAGRFVFTATAPLATSVVAVRHGFGTATFLWPSDPRWVGSSP